MARRFCSMAIFRLVIMSSLVWTVNFTAFHIAKALVMHFFKDGFADACLVNDDALDAVEFLVSPYQMPDDLAVGCVEWELVEVDEFEDFAFPFKDGDNAVILQFPKVNACVVFAAEEVSLKGRRQLNPMQLGELNAAANQAQGQIAV